MFVPDSVSPVWPDGDGSEHLHIWDVRRYQRSSSDTAGRSVRVQRSQAGRPAEGPHLHPAADAQVFRALLQDACRQGLEKGSRVPRRQQSDLHRAWWQTAERIPVFQLESRAWCCKRTWAPAAKRDGTSTKLDGGFFQVSKEGYGLFNNATQHILFTVIWHQIYGKGSLKWERKTAVATWATLCN